MLHTGKKNNNPAYPDYTPSIFPQAVLKELTKSTTLDRFKRAQKRKAPSTTLVSRKERKVKKQLEFEETNSYAKATQLERKYINSECATTDLESEDEASERKKRKSRPNPLYVDGGEEPERGSGKRFAKAPQVNFPEMPASSHFTKAPLSHTVSRAICIEDEELSDPLITSFDANSLTQFQSQELFNDDNIFTTGSSSSGLGSPILTTTGAAPEKSSKETKQLFKVGGVDSGCMIRRMASAVLSNQLACLFNWKGKGGKRAFESTSLLDCMFGESVSN
uniref:DUF4806 domain-containing protein n=1 Tax=Knipowitschia caucasica TaxID=637954 RepID=A0AAV2IYN5_KNICA